MKNIFNRPGLCQATVYGPGKFRGHLCGRVAKYTDNGVSYCGIHHPPRVAEREKKAIKCARCNYVRVHKQGDFCAGCTRANSYNKSHLRLVALEKFFAMVSLGLMQHGGAVNLGTKARIGYVEGRGFWRSDNPKNAVRWAITLEELFDIKMGDR